MTYNSIHFTIYLVFDVFWFWVAVLFFSSFFFPQKLKTGDWHHPNMRVSATRMMFSRLCSYFNIFISSSKWYPSISPFSSRPFKFKFQRDFSTRILYVFLSSFDLHFHPIRITLISLLGFFIIYSSQGWDCVCVTGLLMPQCLFPGWRIIEYDASCSTGEWQGKTG